MGLADIEHIVVHGFVQLDDGQDWSRCADPETTGYTVYRRVPETQDNFDPFDIVDEQDFTVFEEAMTYAIGLSKGTLEIIVE